MQFATKLENLMVSWKTCKININALHLKNKAT